MLVGDSVVGFICGSGYVTRETRRMRTGAVLPGSSKRDLVTPCMTTKVQGRDLLMTLVLTLYRCSSK